MPDDFPEPIRKLPKADIPLEGLEAFLSQGEGHQIIFVRFQDDASMPEHSHESQWEIVLEGSVDVCIDGSHHTFKKGDRFYIPNGIKHFANVHAGYSAIIFFDQKDRYRIKEE